MYKVSILEEELGYIESKQKLKETLKEKVQAEEEKSIEAIDIKISPEYKLKLVNRTEETNEAEIAKKLIENANITYKYYEVALNNEVIEAVDTSEEAEELVKEIKEKNNNQEYNISIAERYTNNKEEVKTTEIEIAKGNIINKANETFLRQKKQKEEEERIKNLPDINGIKLAVTPVSGVITSRYGVSSRIRRSTHTGLDIAAIQGADIKVVADGTVIGASRDGAYGNLVKVDHGDGVETWYAHTSKMYVSVGQKVKAGDVIAAVGSTGNSTGPHLHLEIRVNGKHLNPQNYLYNN